MDGRRGSEDLEKAILWFSTSINSSSPGSGVFSLINALGGVNKVRDWL